MSLGCERTCVKPNCTSQGGHFETLGRRGRGAAHIAVHEDTKTLDALGLDCLVFVCRSLATG